MSKKKGSVKIITLQCTVDKKHRVQTRVNKKNMTEMLELMKYNPTLRKHTMHRELKKA